mmetsp:Transcript_2493/g.7747  ORF Transcript_2493/g.7747 Transcript_2493/m.7747 type:complete len:215 (-) Transcript_2493:191-835(-)
MDPVRGAHEPQGRGGQQAVARHRAAEHRPEPVREAPVLRALDPVGPVPAHLARLLQARDLLDHRLHRLLLLADLVLRADAADRLQVAAAAERRQVGDTQLEVPAAHRVSAARGRLHLLDHRLLQLQPVLRRSGERLRTRRQLRQPVPVHDCAPGVRIKDGRWHLRAHAAADLRRPRGRDGVRPPHVRLLFLPDPDHYVPEPRVRYHPRHLRPAA